MVGPAPECPGVELHIIRSGATLSGVVFYTDGSGVSTVSSHVGGSTFFWHQTSIKGNGPPGDVTGTVNANGALRAKLVGTNCTRLNGYRQRLNPFSWVSQGKRMPGKLAVVTGAHGGLGTELCKLIVARGVDLVLVDRDVAKSAAFGTELDRLRPGSVRQTIGVDLSDHEDILRVTPGGDTAWNDARRMRSSPRTVPMQPTRPARDR